MLRLLPPLRAHQLQHALPRLPRLGKLRALRVLPALLARKTSRRAWETHDAQSDNCRV